MAERSGAVSDAEYRSLASFRHALRTFFAFSEAAARDAGLTPAQHQLLLAVRGWPREEAPAVGDLATFLQSKPHSMLELVRRAEQAGLVSLEPDPVDRRRQLVALTADGDRRLEALSRQHRDEVRRLRAELDQALADLS